MALALYRKYRPRTFAEVIGQEHVTEPLSQALRSGRLHHAYLFSGPRGCGKTSSARILARSLNCEQGPTPDPCGECDSCRSLATDGSGSIDVIEIDAASHGGVDDARELRERAFFAPANSRYKIYVIDEAHMVSSAGFNALLKLVEEPPEYVKFIFATTEPEKVLGTIKSRTHHYPFRLIPPGVLRPYLEKLCETEGVKVDPAVFPLVVRAGGGSVRDTLSVLDQLIAGAGPEGVSYARAVALLGVTDAALIDEMCDALAAGDGAAAFATVDRVAEAGHDPRRFASDLLERLRDLIILQQVPDAVAKGLIDGPADQIERMTAQAARLGLATLSRCADIVHNGLVEMRGTTSPRLLLELICARMLLPGADDSLGGLLQRLERLERGLPSTGGGASSAAPVTAARPASAPVASTPPTVHAPAASAPVAHAPVASAPVGPASVAPAETAERPAVSVGVQSTAVGTAPTAAAPPDPGPAAAPGPSVPGGGVDVGAIRQAWGGVIDMINRTNKRIAALIRDAVVRDLDGDTLVLIMKSPVLARMVSEDADVLTEALYEQFGERWQIRCEAAGAERGTTSAPRPARPAAGPAGGASRTGAAVNGGLAGGRPGHAAGAAASGPVRGGQAGHAAVGGRLGGAVADGGAVGASSANAGDDDWPEAARPGGGVPSSAPAHGPAPSGPTVGPHPAPVAPAGSVSAGMDGSGKPAPAAAPGTGLAAARAAAAGRGGRTGGGPAASVANGRGSEPGQGSAGVQIAERDWAGEPPYDPEYDGPIRSTTGYEGFDPGDEPLDDVIDEQTARQTSEEQALQLLQQAFGAERIGEIDLR